LVRAWKLTCTPPMEPVMIVADSELQELEVRRAALPAVPRLTRRRCRRRATRARCARPRSWLVAAELPGDHRRPRWRARPRACARLVELAETLGAPVIDQASRQNIPTTHRAVPASASRPLITPADVILGLELTDYWGRSTSSTDNLKREPARASGRTRRLVSIDVNELFLKSNYQDFQRYAELDLAIAGDAEATLPALIEACRALSTRAARPRSRRGAPRWRALRDEARAASLEAASIGWDASPISTARLSAELWQAIKGEDWALVRSAPMPSSATGRAGCGASTATTSTSATPAAPASAMACPPRSARRSPTARTAASR
jgi:acetolactate synthase I/II/III large subunit